MNDDDQYIPLLSGKAFCDFTPQEFKAHVQALYFKREPKKAPKKALKPLIFRLNKKGTLCIKVNRDPKWISTEELTKICTDLNKIFADESKKLIKKKIEIRDE